MKSITRRKFLWQSLGASAAVFTGLHGGRLPIADTLATTTVPAAFKPIAGGTLLGTAPFVGEGNFPLETLVGSGLGGRLLLDLSTLTPETLVTPNDKFFIRTRYPDQLHYDAPWTISVRGLVEQPTELSLSELMRGEVSMGAHLIECAGNTANGRFGLISTARWSGIPMAEVLDGIKILPQATRVIISGFDQHSRSHPGSVAGASWIFSFEQLQTANAFLATHMNGVPLPKDHGHPVRLVMPGWYGCTCIKWVNRIVPVDDTALATGHMREYARRTHQVGKPKLAKDFKPALIDVAAMPIRVEQCGALRGNCFIASSVSFGAAIGRLTLWLCASIRVWTMYRSKITSTRPMRRGLFGRMSGNPTKLVAIRSSSRWTIPWFAPGVSMRVTTFAP